MLLHCTSMHRCNIIGCTSFETLTSWLDVLVLLDFCEPTS